MGKFRLQINTYYGEMSIEGDSLDELKNLLVQIGLSSETITTVLTSAVNQMERKDSITRHINANSTFKTRASRNNRVSK